MQKILISLFILISCGFNNKNIMNENVKYEFATLGGGCFWCLEAIYKQVDNIISVESGYAGGKTVNPSYKDVCTGLTGHAEVVQIKYNADKISYKEILEIFFSIHDPTTLNRQGNDIGTQYRSVIFYHNDVQKKIAEDIINKLNSEHIWTNPIVTELSPYTNFYKAEDYHQNYYFNNSQQPYCQIVISPKVEKFKKHFKPIIKTIK
jgi:methionine-S-sulfoxide reductase